MPKLVKKSAVRAMDRSGVWAGHEVYNFMEQILALEFVSQYPAALHTL